MLPRLWILLLVATTALATPQQANIIRTDIGGIVDRMHSSLWIDRSKAFEGARRILRSGEPSPEEKDKLTLGLIDLLTVENAATMVSASAQAANDTEQGSIDEYEQYYASLIGAVANLGDGRAIRALLAATPIGGMATRGVARFGDRALDPVLGQVENRDPQLAAGAVDVLREMLKMHTLTDRDSYLRLKNGLRSALERPEFDVRMSAIGAIEYLSDREEFVPLLRDLAEHDPFNMSQPDSKGGTITVFVVREDAARLLRKIEAGGAQPENH